MQHNDEATSDGPESLQALAPSLRPAQLPALANLRMWQNNLEDQGADSIIRALTGSSALTSLDLEECDIGSTGARDIVGHLHALPRLVALDLRHNPCCDEGEAFRVELLAAAADAARAGGFALSL